MTSSKLNEELTHLNAEMTSANAKSLRLIDEAKQECFKMASKIEEQERIMEEQNKRINGEEVGRKELSSLLEAKMEIINELEVKVGEITSKGQVGV